MTATLRRFLLELLIATAGLGLTALSGSAQDPRLELLHRMRDHVDGTYIMPSFGRYEQSAELVRRVRSELLEVSE